MIAVTGGQVAATVGIAYLTLVVVSLAWSWVGRIIWERREAVRFRERLEEWMRGGGVR